MMMIQLQSVINVKQREREMFRSGLGIRRIYISRKVPSVNCGIIVALPFSFCRVERIHTETV